MILWLAPMDGVTDYTYRRIVQEIFDNYGDQKKHTLWKRTEFMSADGYMINPSRLVKHLITSSDEKNVIAQIYWWNIDTLLKTAQDIERKYNLFQWIELNIWCPSPKILACGAGAWMMKNKEKTLEYIKILSEWLSIPFSIKVRTGLNNDDKKEQLNFILKSAQYCPTITIHGRTYNQAHNGEVDRDFIYTIKRELWNSHTIIWNGGINSYEEYKSHEGKIDGIMIWQSAMQNPWIFTDHTPNDLERIELSLHHLILLGAYEIYMIYTRTQFPEESDQLIINRQYLHLTKKYNPNSDEIQDLPKINFHEYLFPLPNYKIIDEISTLVKESIQNKKDNIIRNDTIFSLKNLRCGVDFRKYLFWYIKWTIFNKELKQHIVLIKDFCELYTTLAQYKQ